MKSFYLVIMIVFWTIFAEAQTYFPPIAGADWETTTPSSLSWCPDQIDSLYTFLEVNGTKAFIVLKDGKIVLEQYFNGHDESASWYWASAGKTLTSFMVGIAQQEGYLRIDDPTSTHVGTGWTSTTPDQEAAITIRNQLTMTTGLDDTQGNVDCTDPACLLYLAEPDTRWAYHNAPYTLLEGVIEGATGRSLNGYTNEKLKNPTGMTGFFVAQGFNNVFVSTARSMARFGLLILNDGNWNGNQVMMDTNYFRQMITTSQDLNEAYGYLWWLNGTSTFKIPQSQLTFPGRMTPNAPADMISALGKNGQFLNIVPSQNLVLIRMGEAPDNTPVPFLFNDQIWEYFNALECTTSTTERQSPPAIFTAFPSLATSVVNLRALTNYNGTTTYRVFSPFGKLVIEGTFHGDEYELPVAELSNGMHVIMLQNEHGVSTVKFVKN